MLDGNRFLPETGMPMRKMACMSSPLALAEPVPFTLANLKAKSFTRIEGCAGEETSGSLSDCGKDWPSCVWNFKLKLLHIPGRGRAALGAKTAVDTEVLVLEHQAFGLRQRSRGVQGLVKIVGGRREAFAELLLFAIGGDCQAQQRANVDARVAFNAARRIESGLDVAVQAALRFAGKLLGAEAKLYFDIHLLEALGQIDVLHLLPRRGIVIVVIAPLPEAHFLADQVLAHGRALGDGNPLAVVVNGNGRLVAMLDCPDDVLWAQRGAA